MIYAIVGLLAIILDQYVKYWVAGNIIIDTGIKEFIPGVVSLVNIHNTGAAFGILSGSGSRILFIAVCLVFTILVIVAIAAEWISGPLGKWSAVLVAAGGIGNCIDRVLYGYVQDMFSLEFINFAIFNVADIFITVFCFVFILYIIFGGESQRTRDRRVMNAYGIEDEEDYEELAPSSRRRSVKAASQSEEDSGYEEDVPQPRSRRQQRQPKPEYEQDEPETVQTERNSKSFYSSVTGKPTKKERQAAVEDEYEQFKAQRAERIRQMQEQDAKAAAAVKAPPKTASKPVVSDDPFAEWERANAASGNNSPVFSASEASRQAVPSSKSAAVYSTPVSQPVAPAAPAAPVAPSKPAANDSYDIDDILKEFDL